MRLGKRERSLKDVTRAVTEVSRHRSTHFLDGCLLAYVLGVPLQPQGASRVVCFRFRNRRFPHAYIY